MRRISATLPVLGGISVELHSESDAALSLFGGDKELERLDKISHLGVAASAFTGVSHSRLEYLLLQCALIGLIRKIHKDNALLTLSSPVALPNRRATISSGEELLKTWAVLANAGHTRFTYGVERTLLLAAHDDQQFASWLTASHRHRDLQRWNHNVIALHQDWNMHYVLVQMRLQQAKASPRIKNRHLDVIRTLIFPTDGFTTLSPDQRAKLSRLRDLYFTIRLIAMVSLDSYYSHSAVRVQAVSALTGLASIDGATDNLRELTSSLSMVAAWLANDLYLHPRAVTLQRAYEIRNIPTVLTRFRKAFPVPSKLASLSRDLFSTGLGEPRHHQLEHFLRVTVATPNSPMLGGNNLFATLQHLEAKVARPPHSYASADRNYFSRVVHLDFLLSRANGAAPDAAALLGNLRHWLLRAIDAAALRIGRFYLRAPGQASGKVGSRSKSKRPAASSLPVARRQAVRLRQLVSHEPILEAILAGLVRYVLPTDRHATIGARRQEQDAVSPIIARIRWDDGTRTSYHTDELDKAIANHSGRVANDRVQELAAIKHVLTHSKAPFVLARATGTVVCDEYGKQRDQWDGAACEIWNDRVVLKVIEAKLTGNKSSNQTLAKKQLRDTAKLLRRRHKLPYSIRTIPGLGAVLSITIAMRP